MSNLFVNVPPFSRGGCVGGGHPTNPLYLTANLRSTRPTNPTRPTNTTFFEMGRADGGRRAHAQGRTVTAFS